jgi:PAS domain S-box-containing protein
MKKQTVSTAGLAAGRPAGARSAAAILAAVFESSEDPVFSVDREYRYTSFNAVHAAAMKALYGADIRMGHSLFEYQTVEQDREVARRNLDRALAGGSHTASAFSDVEPSSRRYFEVRHTPIREGDAVTGVLVSARDITERRHDIEALRETSELLSLAQRATRAGVWDMDLVSGAVTWSPELFELFGLPPDSEASLDAWRAAVLPEDLEAAEAAQDDALARHVPLEHEYRIVRPDGRRLWVASHGDTTYDDAGRPVRMTGFCFDVTARREAEQALRASEELWRTVLENIPAIVATVDAGGAVVFANRFLLDLTGWTWDEVHGADYFDTFLPETEREEVRRLLLAMMREGATGDDSTHENDIVTRDGRRRSVLWSNVLSFDAEGRATGITGLGVDLTERKAAEAALRESEQRLRASEQRLRASETHFRAFFEEASVGMATTSPSKGWLEVNDALCGMLGYSRDELAELTWAELTHPDDLGLDVTQFERMVRGQIDGCALDKRFVRKDGGIIHTHLVVHAVRDADGGVAYFAAVLEDVSERVRAEEQSRRFSAELEHRVEQRTAELLAANRELEAYAYSISHDLRAPLRALDGFSQILLADHLEALDEEGRGHLRRIRASAQRMGQLIDALLLLSRLSRRDLVIEDVDLSGLAESVVARMRAAEPDRVVETRVLAGCAATTDARLAEALLGNLLENAWKFTRGRDEAHVEFGSTMVDGERTFYVRDDGAGFDPRYAEKLFKPFQRLHSAEEYPGTGIGLASVGRIVARLGGRCWAEGAVDGGATFFFTLGSPVERPSGTG